MLKIRKVSLRNILLQQFFKDVFSLFEVAIQDGEATAHARDPGLDALLASLKSYARCGTAFVPGALIQRAIEQIELTEPATRTTKCRSADLDELRKRAERYYAQSSEIDHADEYVRDQLSAKAEGIEEAIEYLEAAENTEQESVGQVSPEARATWVLIRRELGGLMDLEPEQYAHLEEIGVALRAMEEKSNAGGVA